MTLRDGSVKSAGGERGLHRELVEPLTGEGTIARFFRERGNCLHHLSLEVDHIENVVGLLKEKGIRLVNEKPEIVGEMKTVFVHPRSTGGLLIEIVDKGSGK
jgi:methylmalonyl-CoA epimerase